MIVIYTLTGIQTGWWCARADGSARTIHVILTFPAGVNDDSEEESEEGAESRRGNDGVPSGPPLPRIVGLGLCSVFELIRETWIEQPSLCRRALKALLDMLQVAY